MGRVHCVVSSIQSFWAVALKGKKKIYCVLVCLEVLSLSKPHYKDQLLQKKRSITKLAAR